MLAKEKNPVYGRTEREYRRKMADFLDLFDIVRHEDGSRELKFRTGIRFTTQWDIILMSGRTPNHERPGYIYAIWENPSLDEHGNPVMIMPFVDAVTKKIFLMPARFNNNGKLRVPAGYLPPPQYDVSFRHANSCDTGRH